MNIKKLLITGILTVSVVAMAAAPVAAFHSYAYRGSGTRSSYQGSTMSNQGWVISKTTTGNQDIGSIKVYLTKPNDTTKTKGKKLMPVAWYYAEANSYWVNKAYGYDHVIWSWDFDF